MLDAGRWERSEGASREERRTDFHQGGFSGQWESNWNYCLMTEIRKVGNGSFSEKLTAAAAGGVLCVGRGLGMCAAPGRQKVLRVVGKGDWLLESAPPQMMAGPGQPSLFTEATASPLDHGLLPACMESKVHSG